MNLKKIFTGLVLTFLFAAHQAQATSIDVDKMRDEQCTGNYKQIDNFLQYLYRADGNLKDLNSSKIKRIEHLESVFQDYKTSKPQRSAAFNELYNDPDWWVFKLQRNSKKLIGQLESLKKDMSWEAYKKLATQQAVGQITTNFFAPSATRSMEKTVELIYTTADFFAERTEIKDRLEALGASSRLNRVFSDDPQLDGFESRLFFSLPSHLIKCQIEYLGARLNKKQ